MGITRLIGSITETLFPKPFLVVIFATGKDPASLRRFFMNIDDVSEKINRDSQRTTPIYSFDGKYDEIENCFLLRECGNVFPPIHHAVGVKNGEIWTTQRTAETIGKCLELTNIQFKKEKKTFKSKKTAIREFLNGT